MGGGGRTTPEKTKAVVGDGRSTERSKENDEVSFSTKGRTATALAPSSSRAGGPLERLEQALQRPGPSHLLQRLRGQHLAQLLCGVFGFLGGGETC